MYLIFLRKKAPMKRDHYLIQNCRSSTDRSVLKKRGPSNQYRAWILKHVLECDLLYAESTDRLTIEEKTNSLKEHLRTRLQLDQPRAVLACAALVDSSAYSGPQARFSIPVTFYVQTKKTTAIPLEAWFGDGFVWTPVPGGLCGNPEFDAVQTRAVGGSPNILEAGIEQCGPQSKAGDCPI